MAENFTAALLRELETSDWEILNQETLLEILTRAAATVLAAQSPPVLAVTREVDPETLFAFAVIQHRDICLFLAPADVAALRAQLLTFDERPAQVGDVLTVPTWLPGGDRFISVVTPELLALAQNGGPAKGGGEPMP